MEFVSLDIKFFKEPQDHQLIKTIILKSVISEIAF